MARSGVAATQNMIESPNQTWARDFAQRIKKLQTSYADEDSTRRKDVLRREFREGFKNLPQSERKQKVEALKMYFPAGTEGVPKVVEIIREAPAREQTREELLKLLVAAGPPTGERQRNEFSEKLRQAGYGVEIEVPVPAPAPIPVSASRPLPGDSSGQAAEVAALLGVEKLSPEAVGRLQLVAFEALQQFLALHEVATEVRQFFEGLNPQSVREFGQNRPADLRAILADYVRGGGLRTADEAGRAIGKSRAQVDGFIHAPAKIRERIHREQSKFLAPSQIEEVVKKGLFHERNCWLRYADLWKSNGYDTLGLESDFWTKKFASFVLIALEEATRGSR